MVIQIRRCTPEDNETIWKLVSYAYGAPQAFLEKFIQRLNLIGNEFFLNEVDGNAVALARVLELEQNVRGILKPMAGIGMVASAPESRRLGYTYDLIRGIFLIIKDDGFAVSTLYPFKDTFYEALGYAKMPPTQTLELNPNTLSGIKMPAGYSARREEGEDMLKIRRALHEAMITNIHGAVMRSNLRWEELNRNFSQKAVVARNSVGEPEGIMLYAMKGYGEGHSWAETGQINVIEFTWTSLEARDTLLNFIYKHADQIVKVLMVISPKHEDYYHWISNVYAPNLKSNGVTMARIVDVEKSCSGFNAGHLDPFLLEVRDSQIKTNSGVFEFSESDGSLSVRRTGGNAKTTVSIEGLTSILYGTLGEAQLRRLGWFEGEPTDQLFELFPRAVPWLTEDF
jgi:predicted acetyltransferase